MRRIFLTQEKYLKSLFPGKIIIKVMAKRKFESYTVLYTKYYKYIIKIVTLSSMEVEVVEMVLLIKMQNTNNATWPGFWSFQYYFDQKLKVLLSVVISKAYLSIKGHFW